MWALLVLFSVLRPPYHTTFDGRVHGQIVACSLPWRTISTVMGHVRSLHLVVKWVLKEEMVDYRVWTIRGELLGGALRPNGP